MSISDKKLTAPSIQHPKNFPFKNYRSNAKKLMKAPSSSVCSSKPSNSATYNNKLFSTESSHEILSSTKNHEPTFLRTSQIGNFNQEEVRPKTQTCYERNWQEEVEQKVEERLPFAEKLEKQISKQVQQFLVDSRKRFKKRTLLHNKNKLRKYSNSDDPKKMFKYL